MECYYVLCLIDDSVRDEWLYVHDLCITPVNHKLIMEFNNSSNLSMFGARMTSRFHPIQIIIFSYFQTYYG